MTQPAADDIESSFAAFDVFDPQAVKGSIVKIEAKVGTNRAKEEGDCLRTASSGPSIHDNRRDLA